MNDSQDQRFGSIAGRAIAGDTESARALPDAAAAFLAESRGGHEKTVAEPAADVFDMSHPDGPPGSDKALAEAVRSAVNALNVAIDMASLAGIRVDVSTTMEERIRAWLNTPHVVIKLSREL